MLGADISYDIIKSLDKKRLRVQERVVLDPGVAITILRYIRILIIGCDIISGMQFNRFLSLFLV